MRDSQSIYPIFTFHNVSINSQKLIRFIVPSRQFTFHNVSINSVSSKASQNPLRSFTFHNVSINSRADLKAEDFKDIIYIPQCFY